MMKLYDFLPSGNGYKVRLLLHQLEISYERIELDITKGQSRTIKLGGYKGNLTSMLTELDADVSNFKLPGIGVLTKLATSSYGIGSSYEVKITDPYALKLLKSNKSSMDPNVKFDETTGVLSTKEASYIENIANIIETNKVSK